MNYDEYAARVHQLIQRGLALDKSEYDELLLVVVELFDTVKKHGPDAMRGQPPRCVSPAELKEETDMIRQALILIHQRLGPGRNWQ